MSYHGDRSPPLVAGNRKRRRRDHYSPPSFHVLTDGSEHTGSGSVFLTVQETATSLRRYAVSGLPELSARLAADQSFPLHSTKVLCCPTKESAAGLPSLLLTLSQSGAESLTVIGGTGVSEYVELVTATILGRRNYPHVQICEVPHSHTSGDSDKREKNEWYRVYQDTCLLVHAKSQPCPNGVSNDDVVDPSSIVLLYTILPPVHDKAEDERGQSFMILPPGYDSSNVFSMLEPLPDMVVGDSGWQQTATPLDFVLKLNPQEGTALSTNSARLQVFTRCVYVTSPCNDIRDDGLLIRASQQAQVLQRRLPFCVSFRPTAENHDDYKAISSYTRLRTCTTWKLGEDVVDDTSYKEDILGRCHVSSQADCKAFETDNLIVLRAALCEPARVHDENEIDLDDESEERNVTGAKLDDPPRDSSESAMPSPTLLVLGTGCASPSPQRGSSGYALLMPTLDSLGSKTFAMVGLLECGEGTLTNLSRHLLPLDLRQQLLKLRFVWISHGHLDHYGGLPTLVRAVGRERKHDSSPLLIIAPSKVLAFLEASLSGDAERLFVGATHQDMQSRFGNRILDMRLSHPDQPSSEYRPVTFLRSIPVEHCPHSHALLLGLYDCQFETTTLLCFSGDTRPSRLLVNEFCRARQYLGPAVSVLLHEATFDDDERGCQEAKQKRHSTVSEALSIAHHMQVDACLLTHFSQRYPKVPPGQTRSMTGTQATARSTSTAIGFAVDGMRLPLTPAALSNLPGLSQELIHVLQGPSRAAAKQDTA